MLNFQIVNNTQLCFGLIIEIIPKNLGVFVVPSPQLSHPISIMGVSDC
jgi:hypothetical protein